MLYRKQDDYDAFKCIAGSCPKSCCIGWQIVIDDDSLDNYAQIAKKQAIAMKNKNLSTISDESDSTSFEYKILEGVDFEEGCFRQNGRRCSMLNPDNLCSLQIELGEDNLCTTCKQYPRHIEEFQDIREYSLSLSCPEAIHMLLTRTTPLNFIECEDDTEDDPEEFEDYDFMLFDRLEYARDILYKIACSSIIPFQTRLDLIVEAAARLQICYDEGELFEMDDIVSEYSDLIASGTNISAGHLSSLNIPSYSSESMQDLYEYNLDALKLLLRLEMLEDDWSRTITNTISYIQSDITNFKNVLDTTDNKDKSFACQQILVSLLFTYFCGSVYDGQIYARACICTQSVRFMMMIYSAYTPNSHSHNNDLNIELLSKVVYLYSREIEHSDINMNEIIDWFSSQI